MKPTSQYISLPYDFEKPLSDSRLYFHHKKIIPVLKLNKFVDKNLPHLKWVDFSKDIAKKETTALKILAIFQNPLLRLGSNKNIIKNKEMFLAKLNYFISNDRPIIFNITQIAFKIPNPLKTNRTTPDYGELAFLSQFKDIINLIKKVYPRGAKIIILGESYIFYDVVGISRHEADLYFKKINRWLKELKWNDEIILEDLARLEKKTPNFKKEFINNLKELKLGWENGSKGNKNEINNVLPTLYFSANVRKYSLPLLLEIFDFNKKDNSIIGKRLKARLMKQTLINSFHYVAYHKTINTSRLADKLYPNSLKLSCTGSYGNLGIYPISKEAKLYCYHGIPYIYGNKKIKIMYHYDILRKKNIVAYYIKNEKTPFYYSNK